jgi:hypothetical protein
MPVPQRKAGVARGRIEIAAASPLAPRASTRGGDFGAALATGAHQRSRALRGPVRAAGGPTMRKIAVLDGRRRPMNRWSGPGSSHRRSSVVIRSSGSLKILSVTDRGRLGARPRRPLAPRLTHLVRRHAWLPPRSSSDRARWDNAWCTRRHPRRGNFLTNKNSFRVVLELVLVEPEIATARCLIKRAWCIRLRHSHR